MICTNKRDAKSMVKCKLLSIMMAKDGNHSTSTTDSHTQEHFWESQTFGNGIRGTMLNSTSCILHFIYFD
ncbi:hypothetical protein I306_05722 [Cryptococcus gattii EJB2]|uniref:Uncharacterized protein n=1 Tax=Cryptococcus gattii EJB2 TaxID=1296103 RepID=A0ABR5BNP0_9TREE|nr:hypothetical protein I306_05722 [Cryptococcus gattii EJB2]